MQSSVRSRQPQEAHAIFDLDGPLATTVLLHFESWRLAFKREKIDYSEADDRLTRGIPRSEGARRVLESKKPDFTSLSVAGQARLVAQVAAAKQRHFSEILDRAEADPTFPIRVQAQPGVEGMLAVLVARGCRLIVGTASRNAPRVIRQLGLDWAFVEDAIVTPDNVGIQSPSKADIFRCAAKRLEVDVRSIVVVEDAINGISAAHEAELPCLAVAVAESEDALCAAGADKVVPASCCITPELLGRVVSIYWNGRQGSP